MKYYNSYSVIKWQKKYEKTSLRAKSKETLLVLHQLKTNFLNIAKQSTLEIHKRYRCDKREPEGNIPLKDDTVNPQFSVALKAMFASRISFNLKKNVFIVRVKKKKSKTEMTARVQGNKSKHTRG